MVHMIDKAEKLKTQIIEADPFIARESHYEVLVKKAEDNIVRERDKLEDHFKTAIPPEKNARDVSKIKCRKEH